MIKVLIVDDEKDARENLKRILAPYDGLEIIGEASRASEARVCIQDLEPDLLFLDIAMPGESGFQLLESLPDLKAEVIFITAFSEYAIKAFDFFAIGYLVKPIDVSKLDAIIVNSMKRLVNKVDESRIQYLIGALEQQNKPKNKLVIPVDDGVEILPYEAIWHLESMRNYTKIVLEDRNVVSSKNISLIETFLDNQVFMRVHKSYIINLYKVNKYLNSGEILMHNGSSIPLARRRKAEFIDKITAL